MQNPIGLLILVLFSIFILFLRHKMSKTSIGRSILIMGDANAFIQFIKSIPFLIIFGFVIFLALRSPRDDEKSDINT